MRTLSSLVFGLALMTSTAAQIQLVKDVNPTPTANPSSSPGELLEQGGWVYYSADHALYGRELFRTMGTAANTQLVRDLRPGRRSASPRGLTAFRGEVFFVADDGVSGVELWRTGGTTATTRRVLDLRPGLVGSVPEDLVVLGSSLLFTALDTAGVRRLFKTDGSSVGTVKVHDVGGRDLHLAGALVWFRAGVGDRELWRTDGTASGTVRVFAGGNDTRVGRVVALNGRYYFGGCLGGGISGLQVSDGTPGGTRRFLTFPGSQPLCQIFPPPQIGVVGGRLWFSARANELWSSDGTVAGTRMVVSSFVGLPFAFLSFGGQVYFSGTAFGNGLWRTDGTAAGTVLVQRTQQPPAHLRIVHGRLWFVARDAAGTEPWVSDGTAAGTMRLADVYPGARSSDPSAVVALPNGAVAFAAEDGVHGRELFRSMGTAASTQLLVDNLPTTGSLGSNLHLLGEHDGRVFFAANDGTHGEELWVSDGTGSGTRMLADLNPGGSSSLIRLATMLDGWIYCIGVVGSRWQLFASDGSPAGTRRVTNFTEGVDLTPPFAWRGRVYFRARIGSRPTMFAFDPGTQALTQLYRFSSTQSNAPWYTPLGDTLFFFGSDAARGVELWKTDGTARGTLFVKETAPGALHARPHSMVAWRGKLLFVAASPRNGMNLWISDGDGSGTRELAVLTNPNQLTVTEDYVFFTAAYSQFRALYKTDGTTAGTSIVSTTARVEGPPVALGENVLFPGRSIATGRELWRSDGTAAGTQLVAEVETGPGGAVAPGSLQRIGSRFLSFHAQSSTSGRELWVSDGTAAGTVLVEDLAPGAKNGVGTDFQLPLLAGGYLYLTGDNGLTGLELYRVDPGATAKSVGRPCGRSAAGMWASDPAIGGSIRVVGENGPVGARGVMVIGQGPSGPFLDCFYHPSQALALVPVRGPSWQLVYSLPNDRSLLGTRLALQSFYVRPTEPRGFELSNAVDLRFGF